MKLVSLPLTTGGFASLFIGIGHLAIVDSKKEPGTCRVLDGLHNHRWLGCEADCCSCYQNDQRCEGTVMANNWDNLKSKIGAEAVDSIRHDFGRKLDSFRDARETVKIGREVYEQLEKVELANDPFHDLPDSCANSIFIATVDGTEYLVNTEGFSYSRYIAKVKVI